jgi:hypothetical protein
MNPDYWMAGDQSGCRPMEDQMRVYSLDNRGKYNNGIYRAIALKPEVNGQGLMLLIFIVCLLLSGCSQKDDTIGNEVVRHVNPAVIHDTLRAQRAAEITSGNEVVLGQPLFIMNINDEFLLLSDIRSQPFFHVFGMPDASWLYSWGTRGQGPSPNGFISVPIYVNVKGDTLIVYEAMRRQLHHIRLSDNEPEEVAVEELWYEGAMDPLNRIRRMNDSLWFVDYGTSIEETTFEHAALRPGYRGILFTFGEYPESDLESFRRYSTFMKSNLAKPGGSHFAAFYFHHNMFKIYNAEGTLLRHIHLQDPENSKDRGRDPISRVYRIAAWASDDYIYTLGIDAESERFNAGTDTTLTTSLEIWDWDGVPVYRTRFDRLVNLFTVSEQHGKIYAWSALNDHTIFEYVLPDFN